MNKLIIKILLTAHFIFLIGCGASTEIPVEQPIETGITTLINDNQSIWNATKPENYMFQYINDPTIDCPYIDIDPVTTVVVLNSTIASAYLPASNRFIDVSSGKTIDEIFSSMLEESEQDPLIYSANENEINDLPLFNPENGIPESYYFDKSESECDSKLVKISNFQVLDDSTVEATIHRNYALWASLSLEDYSFSFSRSGAPPDQDPINFICPVEKPLPPETVIIENSVPTTSTSAYGYIDIDDIFLLMLGALEEKPLSLSGSLKDPDILPVFNEDYGVPELFYVDETNEYCDAWRVWVFDFQEI